MKLASGAAPSTPSAFQTGDERHQRGKNIIQAILLKVRRVPMRGHLAAFGLILLSIFLAFIPFIFPQFSVPYEDDVLYYYLPAFKWYNKAVESGETPVIVPEIMAGFPLALSQAGGFDDPMNRLIFWTFGFPGGYFFRIFLNYSLAGIFMYLFIRVAGMPFAAGVFAALAYLTAQHLIPGMNILRSNAYVLLPGLFWALEVGAKTESAGWRRVSAASLGALILGWVLISGYTQLAAYGMLAAFAFAVFHFFRRPSLQFFLLVATVFLGGVILALPHIARVLDYIPVTARAGGLSWELAKQSGSLGSLVWNVTAGAIMPFRQGTLQSLHIGVLGFWFAGLAAARYFRLSYVVFFAGLFGLTLFAAFPYPLFWAMHTLPMFYYFRFPPHWLWVASFAFSVLAAIGYSARPRLTPSLLIVFAIVNFILPAWWLFGVKSVRVAELEVTPWVVEQIRKYETDLRSFRTFSLFGGDAVWHLFIKPSPYAVGIAEEAALKREVSWPNLSSLFWGVSTVTAQDNFTPRRYQRLIDYIQIKSSTERTNAEQASLEFPERAIEVLGMMGVKYFWSNVPVSKQFPGEIVKELDTRWMSYEVPQVLYKNERFLPFVYVPLRVQILPENEAENFSRITDGAALFAEIGFIECPDCREELLPNGEAAISMERDEADQIVFRAFSKEPAWVIISRENIPGWEAAVDGKAVPLRFANYAFQGILVPQGAHTITLTYQVR